MLQRQKTGDEEVTDLWPNPVMPLATYKYGTFRSRLTLQSYENAGFATRLATLPALLMFTCSAFGCAVSAGYV
jgi:hypothetical protein